MALLVKRAAALPVVKNCRISVYHTCLPFSESQLGELVEENVLACVDLVYWVAAFGDTHEAHLAVFVDDHTADFGVGSFAAAGCFFSVKFYVGASADLEGGQFGKCYGIWEEGLPFGLRYL